MDKFEVVEQRAIRRTVIRIVYQLIFFVGLSYALKGSLVVHPILGGLGIAALSAYFEVFWHLLPNVRNHRSNSASGGEEYRKLVEEAIQERGLHNMLAAHWFNRSLNDVLTGKRL